ncbi:MAG: hypothetical protein EBR82_61395 [Caulobacteraceae bacterium]|nr:hypothetical protein [Caulobacteraceae bacterium]
MTLEALATHAVIGWQLMTAVLNVILRTRTPEEWVERCERRPRLAAFTRFMRASGVDPVKMVRALGELASGGEK